MRRNLKNLYAILLFAVALNIAVWSYSHGHTVRWPNVPSPPGEANVTASFLGDKALAYRVWAMALQNFGNAGGDYRPLKDYNYVHLGKWFDLLDRLDPHSDFVPLLAAYYFGGTQNPQEQLPHVISYLEKAGSRAEGEKWRWLAQAIYLTRHKMDDMPEALRLAKKLASMYRPGMPAWTVQTQALITTEMGDKQAAYTLFRTMLATEAEHMHPNEVNFMVDYICTKVLTPEQAPHDPICASEK
jgi:hypothetical protein